MTTTVRLGFALLTALPIAVFFLLTALSNARRSLLSSLPTSENRASDKAVRSSAK